MFPAWRLKIREVRLALKDGCWDEAARMLQQPAVREFLPARKLSHQLAEQLLQRAGARMQWGDSSAGWQDVQRAAELGGADEAIAKLRCEQARQGLAAAQQFLLQGESQLALDELARLGERHLDSSESRQWKQVAWLMQRAEQKSVVGNMQAAAEALARARQLISHTSEPNALASGAVTKTVDTSMLLNQSLERREQRMRSQVKQLQRLNAQLHKLIGREKWTGVLATAEAMLELAPEHKAARKAKRRAWQAVGMDVTRSYHSTKSLSQNQKSPSPDPSQGRGPGRGIGSKHSPEQSIALQQRDDRQVLRDSTKRLRSAADVDTKITNREPGRRMVAWIDEVGGFLVCLGDEIVLGQPTPSTHVDLPILADLSRRHAVIRRDGEAYVVTPVHSVSVDGVKLTGPTVLRAGVLIELGHTVKLRFRKPHALSATAVLTLESNHKTEPAVDAIVLMSDSCILGPRSHSHICCRNWPSDLVLMRQAEQLVFHTDMPLEIDGEPCSPPTKIPGNCRLESDAIALSFEEIK